jgi:hypothetical protein
VKLARVLAPGFPEPIVTEEDDEGRDPRPEGSVRSLHMRVSRSPGDDE